MSEHSLVWCLTSPGILEMKDQNVLRLQDVEEEPGVGREIPNKLIVYFSLHTYQWLKKKG